MWLLYPLVGFVTVAYSGMFCIARGLLIDFFGNAHFGSNQGLIFTAVAAGGATFNHIAASIVDSETQAGDKFCLGPSCYKPIFWIGSASLGAAVMMSIVLIRCSICPAQDPNLEPDHE